MVNIFACGAIQGYTHDTLISIVILYRLTRPNNCTQCISLNYNHPMLFMRMSNHPTLSLYHKVRRMTSMIALCIQIFYLLATFSRDFWPLFRLHHIPNDDYPQLYTDMLNQYILFHVYQMQLHVLRFAILIRFYYRNKERIIIERRTHKSLIMSWYHSIISKSCWY